MKLIKDIWSEIQEIKSGPKQLREFGVVMGIFFGIIAALLLWKGKPGSAVWGSLSVIFLLLTFLFPAPLKFPQRLWMGLAVLMGWLMSRVILTVVFFLVLTPLSLLIRLTGKRFLDTTFKKDVASYWTPKGDELPKERYEKQY